MQAQEATGAYLIQLVERARQGDRDAFDGLVDAYASQVYNLALRITGRREDAEDCVQEAFLRAFSSLPSFRGEAAFSTWLYRIALNVANDAARRQSRSALTASELAAGDPGDEPPQIDRWDESDRDERSQPEAVFLARQRRELVLRAIRDLPEHQRTVVVLYDLQGFTYDQIAQITRTRVGTVKSRLNRARLALKDLLAPYLELLRD